MQLPRHRNATSPRLGLSPRIRRSRTAGCYGPTPGVLLGSEGKPTDSRKSQRRQRLIFRRRSWSHSLCHWCKPKRHRHGLLMEWEPGPTGEIREGPRCRRLLAPGPSFRVVPAGGGAGGARTHDPGIMSHLGRVSAMIGSEWSRPFGAGQPDSRVRSRACPLDVWPRVRAHRVSISSLRRAILRVRRPLTRTVARYTPFGIIVGELASNPLPNRPPPRVARANHPGRG